MSYQQTITPNPNIPCAPGWCLAYVNEAFGVPKRFPTATAGWVGSSTKHRDYDFPEGVWVPLWFHLKFEPAGHVALRAPDGRIYSTTSPFLRVPTIHPNLQHLLNAYAANNPLTYLGWTEDVEGTRVMAPSAINPQSTEDDDMPISDTDVNRIASAVLSFQVKKEGGQNGTINLGAMAAWYDANRLGDMATITNGVLNGDVPWFGFTGERPKDGRTSTTLAGQAGWADTQHVALANSVAALTELVKQLSVSQGVIIDYKAIAKAVNDDAAKRLQK